MLYQPDDAFCLIKNEKTASFNIKTNLIIFYKYLMSSDTNRVIQLNKTIFKSEDLCFQPFIICNFSVLQSSISENNYKYATLLKNMKKYIGYINLKAIIA